MSLVEQSLDAAVVVLDDAVFRDIGDELGVAGVDNCAAFVLVELCERGLQTAVVDASTGVRLVERGDAKLSPQLLDLAIADHLVRTGRVQRPESADWAGELINLTAELRTRLAVADGAFAMGVDHIGLLRLSRRDLIAALRPHLLAAQELWQAAALHAELPVGAIVFMPDHRKWPGLFATLAHLSSIPAVALGDRVSDAAVGSARHGADEVATDLLVLDTPATPLPATGPGPDEVSTVDPVHVDPVAVDPVAVDPAESEPAESEPEPDESAAPVEPQVAVEAPVDELQATEPVNVDEQAADEAGETEAIAQVRDDESALAQLQETVPTAQAPIPTTQAPIPPPMPPTAPPPMPAPPVRSPVGSDPRGGTRVHSTHEQDVYFGSFAERGPISVNDHRDVKQSGGPRHYSPPVPPAGPSSPEARRVHNRRLLLGAAAVASSAAVGVVVLTLPWIEGGGSGVSGQVVAVQSTPPASSSPTQTPTTPRSPIDTGAARAPAQQYVPAPSPTAQQAPARTAPRRTTPTRPRPRPRSIPNPIPGLPPILLP